MLKTKKVKSETQFFFVLSSFQVFAVEGRKKERKGWNYVTSRRQFCTPAPPPHKKRRRKLEYAYFSTVRTYPRSRAGGGNETKGRIFNYPERYDGGDGNKKQSFSSCSFHLPLAPAAWVLLIIFDLHMQIRVVCPDEEQSGRKKGRERGRLFITPGMPL